MAKTDLSKALLKRFDRLSSQRQNWETHWQEVADHMMPRKSDVTKKRSRGDKRMELIFDSSPFSSITLKLFSSPTTPVFSLKQWNKQNPSLDAYADNRYWEISVVTFGTLYSIVSPETIHSE